MCIRCITCASMRIAKNMRMANPNIDKRVCESRVTGKTVERDLAHLQNELTARACNTSLSPNDEDATISDALRKF